MDNMAHSKKLKKLKKQVKRQQSLLGALYQVLGAHWASVTVLDVVSAASLGLYNGDGSELLPYTLPSEDSTETVHLLPLPEQSMVELTHTDFVN